MVVVAIGFVELATALANLSDLDLRGIVLMGAGLVVLGAGGTFTCLGRPIGAREADL